jgi:hypothetical protein
MFEFDPAKSDANKAKHGIDFVEAQALWLDELRIEQTARSETEERRLTVARLGEVLWCAVYTVRPKAIRIISVRRARKEEVEAYERDENDRP